METLAEKGRAFLSSGDRLVLYREEAVYRSDKPGIRPLLAASQNPAFTGVWAADKIVGRAAAMLYCLLKVKGVYAQVLSIGGKEILDRHGIAVSWDTLTPAIQNRAGTGLCPMEMAVSDITAPQSAPAALLKALAALPSSEGNGGRTRFAPTDFFR